MEHAIAGAGDLNRHGAGAGVSGNFGYRAVPGERDRNGKDAAVGGEEVVARIVGCGSNGHDWLIQSNPADVAEVLGIAVGSDQTVGVGDPVALPGRCNCQPDCRRRRHGVAEVGGAAERDDVTGRGDEPSRAICARGARRSRNKSEA